MSDPDQMVSFPQAVAVCFTKYFDFSGRASRAEFWWFYLFTTLMNWAGSLVDPTELLSIILGLLFLIPTLAAGARRLHDTGRSGWWLLLIVTLIGLIPLLILFVIKGTGTRNAYGDPVYAAR